MRIGGLLNRFFQRGQFLSHTHLSLSTKGLHCSPADPVELDPAALLLHRVPPQREHCLLPSMPTHISPSDGPTSIKTLLKIHHPIVKMACAPPFLPIVVFLRRERGRGEDEKDAEDHEEEIHMQP